MSTYQFDFREWLPAQPIYATRDQAWASGEFVIVNDERISEQQLAEQL